MTTIVGIAGSLRSGSFNRKLLDAARVSMPAGATIDTGDLSAIPLYDGDVEARDGIPAPVAALKNRIATADGLLIATPEYNNSIPGVLKNAIDWLSRPPADIPRVFGGRPVAVMGASQGGFGTTLSQAAWLPVFKTLGAQVWSGKRLLVSRAQDVFDEAGNITDDRLRQQLHAFVHGFVAFVAAQAKS